MNYRIDENSTNYPCTVVKIGTVHEIEGADNIKRVVLFGNNVIVSKDVKEGDTMLYFVTGTQLNERVCSYNNLYDSPELNDDSGKKGYISAKRRLVKSVKLRGVISDGLLLPIDSLDYLLEASELKFKVGDVFTHIGDSEICVKYIPKEKGKSQREPSEKKPKGTRLKDLLLDNQFRLHHETEHFARNLDKFKSDTEVIITRKYHGSSLILSHVLINKNLNWFEKLIDKYITKLPKTEYGFVWSSGKPKSRLPKGIEADNIDWQTPNPSFYSEDFWKKAYRLHKDKVEKGISIYGEIVGNGIQGSEYTYGFDYEIFVYRITQTNPDGNVYELSWEAVKRYCEKYGLKYVDEYFKGKINELVGEKEKDSLLETLQEKYLDKSYPDCKIDEGVCIRVRETNEIFKLKSPKFILKEAGDLEKGVEQTES